MIRQPQHGHDCFPSAHVVNGSNIDGYITPKLQVYKATGLAVVTSTVLRVHLLQMLQPVIKHRAYITSHKTLPRCLHSQLAQAGSGARVDKTTTDTTITHML